MKYMCFQNLGKMDVLEGKFASALDHFSEALAIDDSDVSLWMGKGKAAENFQNHRLARYVFHARVRA